MNATHSSAKPEPTILRAPLGCSLLLAFIYLVVSVAHILLSDRIVARIASSPEHISRLQTGKGLIFVASSALLIFVIAYLFLRRIARAEKRLIDQQRELIAAERRAAAAMFSHSIAHNINNVLTVGMANAEMLRVHETLDAEGAEMLRDVAHSFERIHEMTRRMARSGHTHDGASIAQEDLAALLREEVRYIQNHHNASNCSFLYTGPDEYTAPICRASVREALDNLLLNAAEATGSGGRIEVHLKTEEDRAIIEIHDNGPGIPPALREQVIQPLFTTKEGGMGLGILSARSAAKQHRGHLDILASPLGGACFRMTLSSRIDDE